MQIVDFNFGRLVNFSYTNAQRVVVMSPTTDDYLSRKLKVLSLGAIILVVFIHAHNEDVKFASGELTGEQSYLVLFVENFFSKGIARIATPMFFAISGFLFFKSFDFTVDGIA